MRKTFAYIITSLLSFFVLVSVSHGAIFDGGIITCGRGTSTPCTFDDALKFANDVIKAIGVIAVTVATITFTIAGWNILTHPDNPGERTKAKEMFYKTLIGIFFLLCAFIIVKLIVNGLGVKSPEGSEGVFRWLKF